MASSSVWEATWVSKTNYEHSSKDQILALANGAIAELQHSKGCLNLHESYSQPLEQAMNDLEQRCVSLLANIKSLEGQLSEERTTSASFKAKTAEQSKLAEDLQKAHKQSQELATLHEAETLKLDREKAFFIQQNEEKNQEATELHSTIQSLQEELKKQTEMAMEFKKKLHQAETDNLDLRQKNQKQERDRELNITQTNWLNDELAKASSEILDLRSNRASELLVLQSKCDGISLEKEALEKTQATLKQRCELIEVENKIHLEKISQLQVELTTSVQQNSGDTEAKQKLIQLYTERSEADAKKIQKLSHTIDSLKEFKITLDTELEREKNQRIQIQQERDSLQRKVDDLAQQLAIPAPLQTQISDEDLQKKIAEIQNSKQSDLLKKLMIAEERYDAAASQLRKLETENGYQKNYMDQMMKEIEAKKPILEREHQAYLQYAGKHQELTSRLEQAMRDNEKLSIETSQTQKKNSILEQKNKDLQGQIADRLHQTDAGSKYSYQYIQPTKIVSQTARSINELVEKNQELLQIIREQSFHQSNAEKQEAEETIRRLLDELAQIKETREREAERIAIIVKQNNMFKVLNAKMQQELQSLRSKSQENTPVASPVKETREHSQSFLPVHDLERELEERGEHEEKLNKEIDQLRREKSKLQGELVQRDAQLNLERSRTDQLKNSFEPERNDNKALRQRVEQLNQKAEVYQQQLLEATNQANKYEQETRKLAMILETKEAQITVLEQADRRSHQQLQDAQSEKRQLLNSIEDLQKVHKTQEAREAAFKRRLEEDRDTLRTQNQALKEKLSLQKADSDEKKRALEHSAHLLQQQVDSKTDELKNLEAQNRRSKLEIETLTSLNSSLETRIKESERRVLDLQGASPANPDSLHLANALTLAKNQKQELTELKTRCEHYQELANTANAHLTELTDSADKRFQKYEEDLRERDQLIVKLQEERQASKDELRQLEEERTKSDESLELLQKTFEAQVLAIKEEKNNIMTELKVKSEELARVRETEHDHDTRYNEVDSKYRAQVKQTFEALSRFEQVEALLKEAEKVKREQSMSIQTQTIQNKALKEAAEKKEHELATLLATNESRIQDLKAENELLHNQLQDIAKRTQRSDDAAIGLEVPPGFTADPTTAGEKTVEGLEESVAYIRRECEILTNKLNITENECLRWKQQAEHAFRVRDEQQALLSQQQQRFRERVMETEEDQQKRESLLESFNLVKESNAQLRLQEKAALEEKEKWQARAEEYLTQIESLKLNTDTLEGSIKVLTTEKDSLLSQIEKHKARIASMVSRQKSIDPQEHEKIKQECEKMKADLATLTSDLSKAQATNEELTKTKDKLVQEVNATVAKANSVVSRAREGKKKVEENLATKQQELVAKQQELDRALENLKELDSTKQEILSLKQENGSVKKENETLKQENASVKQENATLKQQQLLRRQPAPAGARRTPSQIPQAATNQTQSPAAQPPTSPPTQATPPQTGTPQAAPALTVPPQPATQPTPQISTPQPVAQTAPQPVPTTPIPVPQPITQTIAPVVVPKDKTALLKEKLAAAQAEKNRLAAEKAEQDRIAAEKTPDKTAEQLLAEKLEKEKQVTEQKQRAKLLALQKATEKAQQDRIAAEKAEQDRIATEKAEQDRIAAENLAAEKAEQFRIAAEKLATEKAEQDRLVAEKAEQDRIAAEKAEQERLASEKVEEERIVAQKAEQERAAAIRAEQERVAAEKLAVEKAEQDRISAADSLTALDAEYPIELVEEPPQKKVRGPPSPLEEPATKKPRLNPPDGTSSNQLIEVEEEPILLSFHSPATTEITIEEDREMGEENHTSQINLVEDFVQIEPEETQMETDLPEDQNIDNNP